MTFREQWCIIADVVEKTVGVDDAEGSPVPIPNTEVKLSGADDSCPTTGRENREMPTHEVSTQQGGHFLLYKKLLFPPLMNSLKDERFRRRERAPIGAFLPFTIYPDSPGRNDHV